MEFCQKCGAVMIRADLYGPNGLIPLYGGIRDKKELWWVCTSPTCEEGGKNCSTEEIER